MKKTLIPNTPKDNLKKTGPKIKNKKLFYISLGIIGIDVAAIGTILGIVFLQSDNSSKISLKNQFKFLKTSINPLTDIPEVKTMQKVASLKAFENKWKIKIFKYDFFDKYDLYYTNSAITKDGNYELNLFLMKKNTQKKVDNAKIKVEVTGLNFIKIENILRNSDKFKKEHKIYEKFNNEFISKINKNELITELAKEISNEIPALSFTNVNETLSEAEFNLDKINDKSGTLNLIYKHGKKRIVLKLFSPKIYENHFIASFNSWVNEDFSADISNLSLANISIEKIKDSIKNLIRNHPNKEERAYFINNYYKDIKFENLKVDVSKKDIKDGNLVNFSLIYKDIKRKFNVKNYFRKNGPITKGGTTVENGVKPVKGDFIIVQPTTSGLTYAFVSASATDADGNTTVTVEVSSSIAGSKVENIQFTIGGFETAAQKTIREAKVLISTIKAQLDGKTGTEVVNSISKPAKSTETFVSGDLGIKVTGINGATITYAHGKITADGNVIYTFTITKDAQTDTATATIAVTGINKFKVNAAIQAVGESDIKLPTADNSVFASTVTKPANQTVGDGVTAKFTKWNDADGTGEISWEVTFTKSPGDVPKVITGKISGYLTTGDKAIQEANKVIKAELVNNTPPTIKAGSETKTALNVAVSDIEITAKNPDLISTIENVTLSTTNTDGTTVTVTIKVSPKTSGLKISNNTYTYELSGFKEGIIIDTIEKAKANMTFDSNLWKRILTIKKNVVSIKYNLSSIWKHIFKIKFEAPERIFEISDKAFYKTYLKSDSLDLSGFSNLTRIGKGAFYTSPITSLDLSGLSKLTTIDQSAFLESILTSLDLSDLPNLTTIGKDAFRGIKKSTKVKMSKEKWNELIFDSSKGIDNRDKIFGPGKEISRSI